MGRVAHRRTIHQSWLVAYLSGGIIVGVISVQFITPTWFSSIAWLCIGLILAGCGLWGRSIISVLLLVLAGLCMGLWRGSISERALMPYQQLVGKHVILSGTVSDDTDTGKQNEIIVRLKAITISSHSVSGEVWASITGQADIKRGDIVRIQGMISKGFGGYGAAIYRGQLLRLQRPYPGDVARRTRDSFGSTVRRVISEPEASLGLGYLVGQRRALPVQLDSALRIAGLMHVVVASGYNLTILVRLARRLFSKISKYLAALSAASMIVAFIAVTGNSPSMMRAGLVSGLSLAAWYVGRRFHPLVLLPFVAAITLLITPSYGWNNIGWQLSFAAFGGVMIVAPLLQRYFFGEKKPGTIRQILGETTSAQLVTLPILVAAFGQFSNVALIANLVILPLVPLAMLLTFIAGIGGMLLPLSLASSVALPAEWLLRYMTTVAQYIASVPWAQTRVSIGWRSVVVYYAAIVVACFYMWHKTRYNFQATSVVE